jgi:hypothetical protein
MKRLLSILLIVFLSACSPSIREDCLDDASCMTDSMPEINGMTPVEVDYGESFNLLNGVVAYDEQDGYITDHIIVEEQIDWYSPGTYLVIYKVTNSLGNTGYGFRDVTVNYPDDYYDNMMYNGSFDFGLDGYHIYEELNNGHATYDTSNGYLEINVQSIQDGVWYRPRIHCDSMTFETGETYVVRFDAKANDSKLIQVQIGELLDAAPWFTQFNIQVFALTEDYQTFEFSFIMGLETNNNGTMLLELGDVNGDTTLTTIYIDNIEILKLQ